MSFPIYRHDMPWHGALERTGHHVDAYRGEKRASIWKRELSIGRRSTRHDVEPIDMTTAMSEASNSDTTNTAETPERTPLWKRELSFGRSKPDTVEFGDSQSTDEPEHSWWSSRSDEGQAHADDETEFAATTPPDDHDDDRGDDHGEDAASEDELPPAAEQQSIWKRDLSFGRRKATDVTAPVEADDDSEIDTTDDGSAAWWPEPSSVSTAAPSDVEATVDESDSPARPWTVAQTENADEPQTHLADDDEADELAPATEQQSIWKRDLSFGRRKARAANDWEFDVADAEEPEHAGEVVATTLHADDAHTDVQHKVDAESAEIAASVSEAPSSEAPSYESAPDYAYSTAASVDEPVHSFVDDSFAPVVDTGVVETDADVHDAADDAWSEDVPVETARKERKRFSVGGRRGPREPKAPKAAKAPKGSKSPKSPSGGKKIVGLKIGASQITAAHVHSNGSLEVLKMARTPLERGIVVAGELRDPDALGIALKAFFNDNKLPKRSVRLGIASNRVGVRVLDVSGVDDPALLGNAVRFRAQEVLPIPLSEAVLDYRVLRERRDEEGNVTREVLVAFAYRELVDRYASVCRSAGLRLVGIDLDGFALLRALVDPAASGTNLGGAAVVTVALGHDRSIMSVSDGEVCEFTRVIEWGGSSLDTAVARILALTPSQAEPIKRELSLDRNAPLPEGLSPEQAVRARSAMVQEVHAFAREFVSSLQFYQAQPRSLDIGEIVITGGMAHMAGLAQQLQELIGVAVRVGDPLGRVKLAKNVTSDESIGSFALAIGLGIED